MPSYGRDKEDLVRRRASNAVKFVLDALLFASIVGLLILVVRKFQVDRIPNDYYARVGFTAGFILLAAFARIYVRLWYVRIWLVISLLVLSFSISLLVLLGSNNAISYVVFLLIIYGTSIVYNWRYASFLSTFLIPIVISISLFHVFIGKQDIPELINTLMLCIFLWINVRIAKLGYSEIEFSYKKALDYAELLEVLNKDLENRVNERAEQLSADFEKRIEIYEREAEIGYIVRSLIHDIRTPLSSISLSINMLEDDGQNFEVIENSFKQLTEIVDQTEELIMGGSDPTSFSVEESINSAVELVRSQLDRASITINLEGTTKQKAALYGVRSIFLRIVLNPIVNSMEELKNSGRGKRSIWVKTYMKDAELFIEVKDNGEGLNNEEIRKLFDKDYSTKYTGKHFGLGLHFVQRNMIDHFNGHTEVESVEGEFTLVRLIFHLPKNE